MKKAIITLAVLCGIGLMSACKSGAQHLAAIDFANVQEYIAADDENFKVDSINGYSTFSADNRIVIIPSTPILPSMPSWTASPAPMRDTST